MEARVVTPTTTVVHHMFVKMGHQNDFEAEVYDWVNTDIDAILDATTKDLTELFMRQSFHVGELKNLSKENKILRFKISQFDIEKKKLIDSLKVAMKQETEQLRKELREEREKAFNAEKARDEMMEAAKKKKECWFWSNQAQHSA